MNETGAWPVGWGSPQRRARASLTYLVEPGDPALGTLLERCEPTEIMTAIRTGELPKACGGEMPARRAALSKAIGRWRLRLPDLPDEEAVAASFRDGIRLVCPGDAEWPEQLDDLGEGRPYALWVRGSAALSTSSMRSVSIVGSRAASGYGVHMAGEIAADLAENGWLIVSGGAYGIDAAAHRGVLIAHGSTFVVLACGLDHPYPAGHADLFEAVTDKGLVISEWPPSSRATRLRFLVRNRVIAALTRGTVVIEAGERSGALNTARHAAELGRPLMAMPGPVTSAQSAGCHRIIRDWGGALITCAADVLGMLTAVGEPIDLGPPSSDGGRPFSPGGRPLSEDGESPRQGRLFSEGSESPRESRFVSEIDRSAQYTQPLSEGDVSSARGGCPAALPLSHDDLDLDSVRVLDTFPVRAAIGPSTIAAKAGVDIETVIRCLGLLAGAGFIEHCEQGWRLARNPAGP